MQQSIEWISTAIMRGGMTRDFTAHAVTRRDAWAIIHSNAAHADAVSVSLPVPNSYTVEEGELFEIEIGA